MVENNASYKVNRRYFMGGLSTMAIGMAGCSAVPVNDFFGGGDNLTTGSVSGLSIGEGSTNAALILPLTASGGAGSAAQSLKNAAEMALEEFNAPDLRLLVKDDGGTTEGAAAATQEAITQNSRIILGPLFSHTVRAAGQVARPQNIPIIAYSTDSSAATRGVYLLSFLPETDVNRIVDFAASRGKRSVAALVPDNAYGGVVEAAFKEAAARNNMRIVSFERYKQEPQAIQQAANRVARTISQADTLFLPDAADTVPNIVQSLQTAGANLGNLQLIGTGLWNDPALFREPNLAGGWFPAPDSGGFEDFSRRYQARFGQAPVRTATLSYDSVSLIAALLKTQGPLALEPAVLTSSSGFRGVDGIFRFRNNGLNERGLSILQIASGTARTISTAPQSFSQV